MSEFGRQEQEFDRRAFQSRLELIRHAQSFRAHGLAMLLEDQGPFRRGEIVEVIRMGRGIPERGITVPVKGTKISMKVLASKLIKLQAGLTLPLEPLKAPL